MDENTKFDYYYGIEADQFSFYRVPRLLIKDERFKGLSSDAKLLYQVMDAGWYFYRDNVERLTVWYQDWLGEKGRVWDNPIGERNRIIKDIFNLVEKYQLENYINTTAAREKAKWSVIGYASHKEYSLSDILEWYDSLLEMGCDNTHRYTEQIKSLSGKMEELGDNRLDYQANCRLYGDLFDDGLDAIKKV